MAGVENKYIEKLVEQTMLYDFYGELLTDHQKSIYEDVVWNDMSLTEIAEMQGVSRQAVSDLMKRINKLLNGYEDKLHLVAKFTSAKDKVKIVQDKTEQLRAELKSSGEKGSALDQKLKEIEKITDSILEDF